MMPIRRSMKWRSDNPFSGLDAAQRRDIADAVRHGRAVRDPRNAPLAAAWAEELLGIGREQPRRRRWLVVHMVVIAAAALLLHEPAVLVIELVPILLLVILALAARRDVERLERAAAANRELATTFGLEVPVLDLEAQSFVPAIRSRNGMIAIAATIVVMVAVVAVAVVSRDTAAAQAEWSEWAERANTVCAKAAKAAARYRRTHTEPQNDALRIELSLRELTKVWRVQVQLERRAAIEIRAMGEPPPGWPTVALDAFERKIRAERDAVRELERGGVAAFDRAMRKSVAPAINANLAFERAGASTCSVLL